MKKMRVGVLVSDDRKPNLGGAYGYYNRLLIEFKNYSFTNADIIFLSNNKKVNQSNTIYSINWKHKRWLSAFIKVTNIFKNIPFLGQISNLAINLKEQHNKKLKKELNKQVDIIYYLTPNCIYPEFPFICTLWDIGHLTSYSFPELSANQIFESRKLYFDGIPQKALLIFAESNTGKLDIIKYLNINENRIKVIPIFPSEIITDEISIKQPISVNKDLFFIHYPAQYWAHKNHYNLLMAFKEVLTKNPNLRLVLTGSDYGNKEYVYQVITELKLTDAIIDLGFVPIEELKWLYLNSQGLVMPTLLGPTNMPLIEAAELKCPVACSNLPGHIEQLGNYGYYFDPKNPKDIALQINQMIFNNRNGLVKNYQSKFNIENALMAIDFAFTELKSIRFCWGNKDGIY